MKIVFATKNKGKVNEVVKIFNTDKIELVTMEQAGIDIDVVEDGTTFEENAEKKAVEIMKASGEAAIADDSGLEIDFLDKQPGIHSARFLGHDTLYSIKNAKILDMLKDVPEEKRTARFVCAVCLALPDGRIIRSKGTLEGRIGNKITGENGFGYDPIFFIPEKNCYSAELSTEEKNKISHRGKAMAEMREKILEIL